MSGDPVGRALSVDEVLRVLQIMRQSKWLMKSVAVERDLDGEQKVVRRNGKEKKG